MGGYGGGGHSCGIPSTGVSESVTFMTNYLGVFEYQDCSHLSLSKINPGPSSRPVYTSSNRNT